MRVVSLVPSATETLRVLGVDPVACTRFCEQPDLPTVGGTKNPDIDAIVALEPDLVVVNDEENRREDAAALTAAGLRIHSMSPRSVPAVGPAVAELAALVGAIVPDPFGPRAWAGWLDGQRRRPSSPVHTCAVLIWRRPWMTVNRDTYGSSLLELCGLTNVFATAANRYPEVTLAQVASRAPWAVLLPSEPYVFGPRHVPEVQAALPGASVVLVDGRDLFWWGARTPAATDRLRRCL